MPIVTVQIVEDEDQSRFPHQVIKQLANSLGAIFESAPGTTWVKLDYLPRAQYAENDTQVPAAVRPVFVEVLKRSLPPKEKLAAEADVIASTVASILDRPRENVHVLYLPEARDRIAFGGKLG